MPTTPTSSRPASRWCGSIPADAQLALDQAEAQLAQTVREVRTLYANNGTLKAQIALREADVARAQSDVARASDDVARREPLVGHRRGRQGGVQPRARRSSRPRSSAVTAAQSAAGRRARAAGLATSR